MVSRTLYKNWTAITRLENLLLLQLITFTDDAEILAGLQRGFPNLFSPEPVPIRVPYRLIELWYGDSDRGQYEAMCSWIEACERIGIPIAHR